MVDDRYTDALDRARREGLLRSITPLESAMGPVVRVGGRDLLNFSSNDYLGYAARPEISEAACRAIRDFGWGAGASRLVCGSHALHGELERAIATWLGEEDAVLFGSGAAANAAIVACAAGRGDTVLSDTLNHASIIDACRLSGATIVRVPHSDPEALRRLATGVQGRAFFITDTVFSMDGDVAPLAAERDAIPGMTFAVDEAHATGVLGPEGRGVAAETGVKCDFRMLTLSKAFGGVGALVVASRPACDFLRNTARSLMFTTGLPAAAAAAALAGLELIRTRPGDRVRLRALGDRLRAGMRRAGLEPGGDPRVPIVPLIVGGNESALAAAAFLRERGLWVHPIRPPSVPPAGARLRITVTAAHTEKQVDTLLEALSEWVTSR